MESAVGARPRRWAAFVLQARTALVVAAIYYLSARIGFALTPAGSGMAMIWPPAGVAVAAFLLTPTRRWLAVALGVFAANLAANLAVAQPVALALAYAGVNIVEPLLIAGVARRRWGGLDLSTPHRAAAFLLVAVAGTSLAAAAGSVLPALHGDAPYRELYLRWLVSDCTGVVALAPLLVLWKDGGRAFLAGLTAGERIRLVLWLAALTGVNALHALSTDGAMVFAVLGFSILMGLAFDHGLPGVAAGVALEATLTIAAARFPLAPPAPSSPAYAAGIIDLQLFLLAAATASIVAAAALDEQRRLRRAAEDNERELQRSRDLLEVRLRLSEFAANHSLHEVMTRALDEAEALTGSRIGFFHFLEPDQRTLLLQTWSTNTLGSMCSAAGNGRHYPVDQAGVWVDCIASRGPVVHNDYAALPHRKGLPPGHAPVSRELVVPIIRGGLVVGVFGIGNKPRDYAAHDIEVATALANLCWDIVAAMRTQRELVQRTATLDAVFESAPMIMALVDGEARVLRSNRSGREVAGAGAPGQLGLLAGQAISCVNALSAAGCGGTPDCARCPVRARVARTVQTGEPCYAEEGRFLLLRDGAPTTVNFLISTSPVDAGGTPAVLLTLVDVTALKRTEEGLRASEEKFRELFNTAEVGMFRSRLDGSAVLDVNDKLLEILGRSREEVLGRPAAGLWCDPVQREEAIRRLRADGRVRNFECRMVTGSGEVRTCIAAAALHRDQGHMVGSLMDVTESRALEEQLRHAQKMEAVGRLTGGIAHDFNNILNVIKGYGFLLGRDVRPGSQREVFVREILAATERGAEMTRSLLLFGKPQQAQLAVLDLNEVVRSLARLLGRILGEGIRCELALADDAPLVEGDAGQLGQVLMNFATNARDAMAQGGTFVVTTGTLHLAAPRVRPEGTLPAGPYAVLGVRDTGQGMSAETRQRIFEPFYTTKGPGLGTGLGLSVVFGIVQQHHGQVSCASEPGAGTTFSVYLPLAGGAATPVRAAAPEAALPEGTERVLLAEDDESARRMLAVVLERCGYRVTAAADGDEALQRFREAPEAFDLLILDLAMPGAGGLDVLEGARRLRPGVRSVLMSGYSTEAVQDRGLLAGAPPILQKPITIATFCAAVRQALDAGGPGAA
jgi:PAS domain S-box-containing protein